jgi:hypothetical protein
MATKKQCSYIVMLMSQLFGGEDGRKMMLSQYFGKKSTKDFTFEEAKLAIELLLNQNEPLKLFYEQNRKR